MISFGVCCLLILTSVVSCHDKPGIPTGNSYCNQNPSPCKSVLLAKDYFCFKMGSYWVYEEETSHERDSIYVIEYYSDENGYNFFTYTKSSLTNYEYRFWPTYTGNISGCTQSGTVTKRCLFVNRSKGKFQDDLGESQVFFVNYKVGDHETTGGSWDCPNNEIQINSILDSFIVQGTTFYDIVSVKQDCEHAEGKQPTKFYYSKNVGIIRKELIDSNQVWNLVNYSVIQ